MSRDRKEVKYMSASELKSKLYAHFDKSGSFDHLRTQLRGQLVTELFKVATPVEGPGKLQSDVNEFGQSLLPLQVSNWLVYDHLLRQGYQYALSTFVSEAHLPYPEKLLTACDILGLFGLDSTSSEYQYISTIYASNNDNGFLHSLLVAVIKSLFEVPKTNAKLRPGELNIPKPFANDAEDGSAEHFSKSFINSMNLDKTKSSVHKESLNLHEFTRNSNFVWHPDKSTESDFFYQLQFVKQENEREIQKLRHKLLEEIDKLHSQEQSMHIEMEHEKNEIKRERSKLFTELEKIKEKELLLEKEYENKFHKKMRDSEEEFHSKLHLKEKEFQSLQGKLLEKEQRLSDMGFELTNLKENNNILKKELDELQHMYKIVENKYSLLLDENTSLSKKFESMSDYSIVKEDLSEKTKTILNLKKEITEVYKKLELEKQTLLENIKSLERQLKQKEPQLLEAEEKLSLTKEALQKQETIWSRERRQLEQELQLSKELQKDVIQRLDEQREDIQDLHRTIHILHYQLTNDISNSMKPNSQESLAVSKLIFGNQKRNYENLRQRNAFSRDSSQKYREQSLNFITEAKNRIDKLQQEAEQVQNKYFFLFSALKENDKFKKDSTIGKKFSASKTDHASYELAHASNNFTPNFPKNYFDVFVERKMASNVKNVHPAFHDTKFAKSLTMKSSNNKYQSSETWDRSSSPNIIDPILHNNVTSNKELGRTNFKHNYIPILTEDKQISYMASYNSTISGEKANQREEPNKREIFSDVIISTGSTGPNPISEPKPASSYSKNTLYDSEHRANNNLPTEVLAEGLEKKLHTNSFTYANTASVETKIPAKEDTVLSTQSQDQDKSSKNVSDKETVAVSEDSSTKNTINEKEEISKVFQTASIKTDGINTAKVIDLDAAWKQKSFISSVFPLAKKVYAVESNLGELANNGNSIKDSKDSPYNQQFTDAKNSEFAGNASNISLADIKELTPSTSEMLNIVPPSDKTENLNLISSNSGSKFDHEITTKQNIETKKTAIIVTEQKLAASDNNTSPTMQTQSNPEQSDPELKNADSLSELSEVHLSCGSEQEQQKEDSDFW